MGAVEERFGFFFDEIFVAKSPNQCHASKLCRVLVFDRTRKSKDDSARQDARNQQQLLQQKSRLERNLAKEQRQREADERKQFFDQKRKIDDQDRQLQDRLRAAVEQLYPEKYVEIVRLRRQRLVDIYRRCSAGAKFSSIDSASSSQVSANEDANAETVAVVKEEPEESVDNDAAASDMKTQESPTLVEKPKLNDERELSENKMKLRPKVHHPLPELQAASGGRKRLVIPDRFKTPSDALKLCENCHLPLHDLLQCPFPLELTRLRFTGPKKKSGRTSLDKSRTVDSKAMTESAVSGTPHSVEQLGETQSSVQTPTVLIEIPEHESAEQPSAESKITPTVALTTKTKFRTVCSLCKDPGKLHARKHCDQLTDHDKQQVCMSS